MISLISPLIYSGEFYPYLTIFDTDFRSIQNACDRKRLTDTIIGATNPFILKSFNDLPNVYQFEDRKGLHCVHSASTCSGISPYKNMISQLLKGRSKETAAINNSVIRKHFRELTISLIQPFQQYLEMDMHKIRDAPYSHLNSLKPFVEQEFLSELSNSKNLFPLLKFTTRQKALGIYSRFLRSTTFNK